MQENMQNKTLDSRELLASSEITEIFINSLKFNISRGIDMEVE